MVYRNYLFQTLCKLLSLEPEEVQHLKAQLDKYNAVQSEELHVTFKETSDLSVYEFLGCFECQMMRTDSPSDITTSSVTSSMFDSTASLGDGTDNGPPDGATSTKTAVCSSNAIESGDRVSSPRSSAVRVHLQTGLHEAKMNRLGL